MAIQRTESIFRWVWEASRGNPVKENATLTCGTDGNLVLADTDGSVAWQTNTAKKGVVGFQLLPNGNIVLHDSKGNFVWQSFDYPTDTLLVGQSLKVGGVTKLVSRLSKKENVNGPYSLSTTFNCDSEAEGGAASELPLDFQLSDNTTTGKFLLGRLKYNGTASFIRIGIDGNVKIYTYYDKVSWGGWEVTLTLFNRESIWETECQLPERCGSFGLCEDNQCVACPSPNGLLGWSNSCQP
ncbi:hypothetical protein FNV43_RR16333 [Rhamnella rubrinervis]|uniref:Bulb-type lectin domain-containing protein n=1 Tax=Rhamnella rubrinervis TaxID=2594499 RepID=A0A8K0MCW4_9ROSA|nr:hypothetical protein FNV43_RR16333 [Rhamnella rubrinervis]